MSRDAEIKFKLSKIETLHFEKSRVKKNLSLDIIDIQINLNFEVNFQQKSIGTIFGVKYFEEEKNLIELFVKLVFEIEQETWQKLHEGNSIKIPRDFARHLAVLSVGTARGILHCKTEKTVYNKLVLPPINLTEVIKQDIEIFPV